jgi:hypothetical protein
VLLALREVGRGARHREGEQAEQNNKKKSSQAIRYYFIDLGTSGLFGVLCTPYPVARHQNPPKWSGWSLQSCHHAICDMHNAAQGQQK